MAMTTGTRLTGTLPPTNKAQVSIDGAGPVIGITVHIDEPQHPLSDVWNLCLRLDAASNAITRANRYRANM